MRAIATHSALAMAVTRSSNNHSKVSLKYIELQIEMISVLADWILAQHGLMSNWFVQDFFLPVKQYYTEIVGIVL